MERRRSRVREIRCWRRDLRRMARFVSGVVKESGGGSVTYKDFMLKL